MHKSISSPSKAFAIQQLISYTWCREPLLISEVQYPVALQSYWLYHSFDLVWGAMSVIRSSLTFPGTVKMAGPRRVWINMCFSESYVQFALCHLNCSYYYFKWIHLSMWSLSLPPLITSTSQCSPRTRLLRAHSLKSALMFWIWRLAQNKFVWSN